MSDPRSKQILLRQAVLAGVTLAVLALYTLFGYLLYLNHRISMELADRQWRTPTEFYSDAGSDPRPILKLYGSDWRVTTPVLLTEIPDYVGNAFIAAEDVRFRRHIGVDPIGILRALLTNFRAGGIAQGGSTIDQQLIKTKFLSHERTYRRKLIEMFLALLLDARMTKNDILEAYLNEVYLGHFEGRPVIGIDEAAHLFFSKHPSQLTVDEAALIAGIIRAPNRDTPDKRPDLAHARRDAILKQMQTYGWLSRADLAEAESRPVRLRPGAVPETPYRYYFAALRAEIAAEAGADYLTRTGLKIYCGMNPNMQKSAERAALHGVDALSRKYSWLRELSQDGPLEAAILSVDPRTGSIRALVGGTDFKATSFDRTTRMKRQPGSAFKTFAYLSAIESKRATTTTLLLDTPLKIQLAGNETWEPHNYDERYRGRVTLRDAFEKSLNVPTVRLAEEIGIGRVASTANRFGFQDRFRDIPALPLGVEEVTMRDLTGAYTAFPNLGTRVRPHLLNAIKDRKGNTIFEEDIESEKVIDPAPAYVMHSLLRGVVKRGTASRIRSYGLGQVAGKTGTTNDYRDAWFVGYTTDVVTSVWVGFDRGAPLRLSSAEAALPIWAAYMSSVPLSHRELLPPKGVVFRDIDPESGLLWQDGCPGPVREVFLSGTAPTHTCPSGFFGSVIRKIFFDNKTYDEPAAITFDQFRRWASEIDRDRQQVESTLNRIDRIIHGGKKEKKQEKKDDSDDGDDRYDEEQ